MKSFFIILGISFPLLAFGECESIYTLGNYQKALEAHQHAIKQGPLRHFELTLDISPKFLEKNGDYAGGEAFCSIMDACRRLHYYQEKKLVSVKHPWHVYAVEANWQYDVYELRANEYRFSRPVIVSRLARMYC